MLPIAHFIITTYDLKRITKLVTNTIHEVVLVPILIVIGLVFCSTSVIEPAYPKGDILIDETYQIQGKSTKQILTYLAENGMTVRIDSILFLRDNRTRNEPYFQIERYVASTEFGVDTIHNINFQVDESSSSSSLYLINLSVQNKWNLQNWKTLKNRTKQYKQIIEEQIINKLNEIQ